MTDLLKALADSVAKARAERKAITCHDCWNGKHHYCIAYYGGACPCESKHDLATVEYIGQRNSRDDNQTGDNA